MRDTERLRTRVGGQAWQEWRKHLRHCAICSAGMPDPETTSWTKLCAAGCRLRDAWKNPEAAK